MDKRPSFKFLTSVAILLIGAASINPALGQELVIPANSIYTVTAAESDLKLERLSIGDNARIEFAADVEHWNVDAMEAHIGSGVVIDGRGKAGDAGLDGNGYADLTAADCGAGRHGDDGLVGGNGGDGISLSLRLGLQHIGTIRIDTSGGDGGRGGKGGSGQSLESQKNCKKSVDGGNGGAGTDGGKGGDGGNIQIFLWAANKDNNYEINIDSAIKRFELIANGGIGGEAGPGGPGGAGSPGKFINRKSLLGNRTWMPGGDEGSDGQIGSSGRNGKAGSIEIGKKVISRREMISEELTAEPSTSSVEGDIISEDISAEEISELKDQIKLLQQRLEVLEAERD